MGTLQKSITINMPADKLHKYMKNPTNWSHWYANLSEAEKITGEGEAGTIVESKYSVLGVSMPITTEVLESTVNVWRGKISGAITSEQSFELVPRENGTEINMKSEYSIPSGVFGKVADKLVVEKIIEHSIDHTLENLKLICESMK